MCAQAQEGDQLAKVLWGRASPWWVSQDRVGLIRVRECKAKLRDWKVTLLSSSGLEQKKSGPAAQGTGTCLLRTKGGN